MSMDFNDKRCAKRNRQAALRYGIDTAPINFVNAPEANGLTLTYFEGKLPKTSDEALAMINAMLPDGVDPLTADDVYIHYMEAANNSFIEDRFMFLGEDTLRNIAKDAAEGSAFMNSHRTGGMSTDAEFAFGKTFAGQYQRGTNAKGEVVQRPLLGMYMLRGVKPNGDSGPSTDDLDKKIRGGTLFNVSVGLTGGEKICDVCDNPLRDSDCSHVPGAHYSMSSADKQKQKDRGVPEGRASYTYRKARLGEVSGVFKGAVRGAGFRKAQSLAASLKGENLKQVRDVYSDLWSSEEEELMSEGIFDRFADYLTERFPNLFGDKSTTNNPPAPDAATKPEAAPDRTEENSEMSNKPGDMDVEKLRRDSEELATLKTQQRKQSSMDFATEQVTKNKSLLPFGVEKLQSLHEQLSLDDVTSPLSHGSRVEQLKSLFAAIPPHSLTKEQAAGTLPAGASVLTNDADDPVDAENKRSVESARKFGEQRNATGPRTAVPSNK
jgi:hypothetical protein